MRLVGYLVNVILVASSLLPSQTTSKQDTCFLGHNLEFTQDGYRYLLCYTVNFVLTDTLVKRTPGVCRYLSLLPLFASP